MTHPIRAAAALLILAAPAAALADAPKLGEKFRAVVAQTAREADAVEKVEARAGILADTGNARALAGDKEGARADLRKAGLMARGIEDAARRARTLAAVGLGLARAGDAAGAHDAFRDALQATDAIDDPEARAQRLAEIGEDQAKGGDKGAARESFAEALKCVDAIKVKGDGASFEAFSRSYTIAQVLEHELKGGLVAEALAMAEDGKLLEKNDSGLSLLRALERALESAGRDDRRRVVDWVRDRAESAPNDGRPARGGGPAGTASQFMASPVSKPALLEWLAKAEAQLGDFDAAVKVAESIGAKDRINPWRVDALTAIAEARIDAGDRDTARESLRELAALYGSPQGRAIPVFLSGSKLVAIAKAQARAGDVEGASKTIATLDARAGEIPAAPQGAEKDEGFRRFLDRQRVEAKLLHARAQAALGVARAARGDAEGARRDLQEATELVRAAKGLGSTAAEAWKDIAAAQALAGDVDAAVKAADAATVAARERPTAPDGPIPPPPVPPAPREGQPDFVRLRVLDAAFEALLKAGDRAAALRLIDADTTGFLATLKLGELAASHARAGDVDSALALLDRLSDPFRRASALLSIAEAAAPKPSPSKPQPTPAP